MDVGADDGAPGPARDRRLRVVQGEDGVDPPAPEPRFGGGSESGEVAELERGVDAGQVFGSPDHGRVGFVGFGRCLSEVRARRDAARDGDDGPDGAADGGFDCLDDRFRVVAPLEVDRELIDRARRRSRQHGVDGAGDGVVGGDVELGPLLEDGDVGDRGARIAGALALAGAAALCGRVHRDEHRAGARRVGRRDADGTPVERRVGRLLARGEEPVAIKIEGGHRRPIVPIRARAPSRASGWGSPRR